MTKGLHRTGDHDTSIAAAEKVDRETRWIQGLVVKAFREHGPMTDNELEALPEFADFKKTTARKRRTELFQAERLIKTRHRRGGQAVWSLPRDRRLIGQWGFG
jgi:hypothetical protein